MFPPDSLTLIPNSTLTNATTSARLGDASNVSLGEVFGMFLTLSFCLVSQPSGSLIYRPWPHLFWRLSPIACLAETAFIFFSFAALFVGVFWDVINNNCFKDIPVQWRRWAARAVAFHRKFCHESHALACALLLVRADVGREKPQVLAILEKLGDTGLFDTDGANQDATEGGRGLLGTAQEHPEVDVERASAIAEPSTIPHGTVSEQLPTTGVTATPSANAEATTQTDTQESPTIDLTAITRSTQQAVALRQAFGANVFAHRELSVQAVILLSITSVAAKLCTSTLPLPLASAAFFMLFSWLSVQAVLFTFHARPLQEMDIKAVTEATRTVAWLVRDHTKDDSNQEYPKPWVIWWLVGLVVGIPLYNLVLYGSIPKRWDAPDPIALDYVAMWILRVLGTGTMLAGVWAQKNRKEEETKKNDEPECGTAGSIVFAVFVILAYVDILVVGEFDTDNYRFDSYLSSMFLWFLSIFPPSMVLPMICAIGTPVFRASKIGAAVGQGIVLVGTAFAFGLWMSKYDPAGTSQPDWIKWLG